MPISSPDPLCQQSCPALTSQLCLPAVLSQMYRHVRLPVVPVLAVPVSSPIPAVPVGSHVSAVPGNSPVSAVPVGSPVPVPISRIFVTGKLCLSAGFGQLCLSAGSRPAVPVSRLSTSFRGRAVAADPSGHFLAGSLVGRSL